MSIDINDLIKKHVNGHETDIDPSDIWAGIQAKQKVKSSKKRRGFLYLSLVLVPMLCWIGTKLLTENLDDSKLVEIDSLTETSEFVAVEKSLADQQAHLITTQETNPSSPIDNNFNPNRNKSLSSVITSQSKTQNSVQQLQYSTLDFANPTVSTDRGQEAQQHSILLNPVSELIKESVRPSLMVSASNEKLLPLSAIDLLATDYLSLPFAQIPENIVKPLITKKAKWFISAATGYSKILGRSISSEAPAEQSSIRNNSETVLDAISGNLLLSYRFNNKFSFSTGLNYQRDYELFEWAGSYIEGSQGTASTTEEAQELPSSFRDTYYGIERNSRIYNQYQYYGVPLFLRYELGQNKMRTALQLGITANVHKSFNGVILNQENLPVELATVQEEFKVGLKYSCALLLDIPVYRSWALYSSLGYSHRKINQRDLSLSYNYLDLRLGIKRQF